jgi:hypothetical protein
MTVDAQHTKLRNDGRSHIYLIITTDGYENSSKEYSFQRIRGLVDEQQYNHGWKTSWL